MTERAQTDRPTIEPPEVSDLTEADRELVAVLVDVISDGAGVESFDRDDWARYTASVLEYKGVDRSDVVIIADSTGAEVVDRSTYLAQRSAIAGFGELASLYLRRIDGWTTDEIAGKSDLEISRRFLARKGYLPIDDATDGGDE